MAASDGRAPAVLQPRAGVYSHVWVSNLPASTPRSPAGSRLRGRRQAGSARRAADSSLRVSEFADAAKARRRLSRESSTLVGGGWFALPAADPFDVAGTVRMDRGQADLPMDIGSSRARKSIPKPVDGHPCRFQTTIRSLIWPFELRSGRRAWPSVYVPRDTQVFAGGGRLAIGISHIFS